MISGTNQQVTSFGSVGQTAGKYHTTFMYTPTIHLNTHTRTPHTHDACIHTHLPVIVVNCVSKPRSVHHRQPQPHSSVLNINSEGVDLNSLLDFMDYQQQRTDPLACANVCAYMRKVITMLITNACPSLVRFEDVVQDGSEPERLQSMLQLIMLRDQAEYKIFQPKIRSERGVHTFATHCHVTCVYTHTNTDNTLNTHTHTHTLTHSTHTFTRTNTV